MISPIQGVPLTLNPSSTSVGQDPGQSFGKMLNNALSQVNSETSQADSLAVNYAAGGPVSVDQLMMAEQQASLGVDLVVQVRDRVVSAYQSIMNMQV